MTKRQTHGPIRVRHVATDSYWDVPRDVYSNGGASTWSTKSGPRGCCSCSARGCKGTRGRQHRQSLRVTELEALIAQQSEVIARLEEQNKRLEQASPEATTSAMSLMNATAQAQQLRVDLQKDMGAIAEWRQKYNEDVSVVADEVRRKGSTLDTEKQNASSATAGCSTSCRQQTSIPSSLN